MGYVWNNKGSRLVQSGDTMDGVSSDGTFIFTTSNAPHANEYVLRSYSWNGTTFVLVSTSSFPGTGWYAQSICMGPPGWVIVSTVITVGRIWAIQYDVATGVFTGSYYYREYNYSVWSTHISDIVRDTDGVIHGSGYSSSYYIWAWTFDGTGNFTLRDVGTLAGGSWSGRAGLCLRTGGGIVVADSNILRAYSYVIGIGWTSCGIYTVPAGRVIISLCTDGTYYYIGTELDSGAYNQYVSKLSYDGANFALMVEVEFGVAGNNKMITELKDTGDYLFVAKQGVGYYLVNKATLGIVYGYPYTSISYDRPKGACVSSPYIFTSIGTFLDNLVGLKLDLFAAFTASATTGNAPLTINFTAV